MDVRLPDGTIIKNVPDGITKAQLTEKLKANGYDISGLGESKKEISTTGKVGSWANEAIAGVADSVLNTPTNLYNLGKAGVGSFMNAIEQPDLAPGLTPNPNLASRAMGAMGLTSPDAQPTSGMGKVAKAGVQGATVGMLSPAQGVKQALANSVISGGSNTAGEVVSAVTGKPELGMAATMATVPVVSAASNMARTSSMKAQSRNEQRDATLKAAQEEGYVVPPSASGGNWFTRRLESIAGKDATAQEATVKNQEVTNKIARKETGLPEDKAITVEALNERRRVLAAPYREIAGLNKQAAKDLEKLKETRAEATSYWKHYDVSADPKSQKQARKLDADAEALELKLEQAATRAMKPELIKELREARVAIAKTYDVERALNVGDGNVSAAILGKAADRGKVSGGLKTAGEFQQAFPRFAREGEKMPTPGVSKSEAIMGSLLGLGGAAAFGPAGWGMAALPLLSGPTRGALLSRPMQSGPSYPGASLPEVSDPFLRSILLSGQ